MESKICQITSKKYKVWSQLGLIGMGCFFIDDWNVVVRYETTGT